ncbi:ankyrin repeat domain-containing protein [Gallaecimonas sp. GXIMD4217]|uniref:ankyrin repeat domain-containing protein n=1 Tax=Gallaecimonas sp. GXIMD4217 TaxID=3131927 RepID=UPI00311B0503
MDKAAFFDAIREGNEVQVHRLLDAEAGLSACRTTEGLSPLMLALYHRHDSLLPYLRRHCEPDIWEAAALGDLTRIDELLGSAGELVDLLAVDGFAPLHLAVFFGHAQAAQHLVLKGADVDIEASNPSRVRPIHSAAAHWDHAQRLACIGLLIGADADINAVQAGGFTALHAIARRGDRESCEHLLAAGALDVEAADGKRPSDLADAAGFAELATLIRGRL